MASLMEAVARKALKRRPPRGGVVLVEDGLDDGLLGERLAGLEGGSSSGL